VAVRARQRERRRSLTAEHPSGGVRLGAVVRPGVLTGRRAVVREMSIFAGSA